MLKEFLVSLVVIEVLFLLYSVKYAYYFAQQYYQRQQNQRRNDMIPLIRRSSTMVFWHQFLNSERSLHLKLCLSGVFVLVILLAIVLVVLALMIAIVFWFCSLGQRCCCRPQQRRMKRKMEAALYYGKEIIRIGQALIQLMVQLLKVWPRQQLGRHLRQLPQILTIRRMENPNLRQENDAIAEDDIA